MSTPWFGDAVRPHLARVAARAAPTLALALALLGAPGCTGPQQAPAVAYTLLEGTRADIQGLRGQVVLVNFWATSCAVCVREMPQLAALHERLAARGFTLLAVAMSHDPPALVSHFAQSRALPFAVAIDNTGAVAKAFDGVQATPTSYLIDRRGRIVRKIVGAPDFTALGQQIEGLLAEGG